MDSPGAVRIEVQQLSVWFGRTQILHDVSCTLPPHGIAAILGPSGSGKTTLLKALNRLNELQDDARTAGRVLLDGADIYAAGVDLPALRRRVGLVLQRASMFDASIFDNVAYGLRLHDRLAPPQLQQAVAGALQQAGLWAEVAERLGDNALTLSGGQQQRLCIARALAVRPQVLLLDEPTAGLDSQALAHVEALLRQLAHSYTLVLVTHDQAQAQRLARCVVRLEAGRLVAGGGAAELLAAPPAADTPG